MMPLPHPPVELTWDEAGELGELASDAFLCIARGGNDALEARLLAAVEFLAARRLSAWSLAAAGGSR
jgi:hypothetical protein